MDPNLVRVDPSLHEADYEGLEGELRSRRNWLKKPTSIMPRSTAQWDIAEERDMDMVEEGIERLGDLVASGWFERNPKDGALRELIETAEEDEIL